MSEYSEFLKHMGTDVKDLAADMLSKIPDEKKYVLRRESRDAHRETTEIQNGHTTRAQTQGVLYRHYGSMSFRRELVKPVRNRASWGKPVGGFWASRLTAKHPWSEWCRQEDFRTDRLASWLDFTLREGSDILLIRDRDDLRSFKDSHPEFIRKPEYGWTAETFLDFEKLAGVYDGVEILAGSDGDLYFDFYGWDCDSICIFNPDSVIPNFQPEIS